MIKINTIAMKKILLLCFLVCVSYCGVIQKDSATETDLVVSISAPQVNFIDFPIFIESIELVDDNGVEQQITSEFSLNLANLGEDFHLVGRYKDMPIAKYSRLKVNLKFSKNSDIVFYSTTSNKKFTKKLLSPRGKELGTELDKFTLDVPLIAKDQAVKISNAFTHLNIAFNLNNMIAIREGKDDVILELRPLLNVTEIKAGGDLKLRGEVKALSKGSMRIKTEFLGSVDMSVSDVKWIKLDNKKLKTIKASSVVSQSAVADVTMSEKGEIKANTIKLFSSKIHIFKGSITDKDEAHIEVLGNNYAKADYLNRGNVYIKFSVEDFPIPSEKTKVRFPVILDISKINISKSEASVLKGPESYAADVSGDNDSAKITTVENESNSMYFYYSKETNEEEKKSFNSDMKEAARDLTFIGVLSIDGIYAGDYTYMGIDISNFGSELEDGFYQSKVNNKTDENGLFEYFSAETLIKVSADDDNSYQFDFTGVNMQVMDRSNLFGFVLDEYGYPDAKLQDGGKKLTFLEFLPYLFDWSTGNYDMMCSGMVFDFVDIPEDSGIPRITLEYLKGGENSQETDVHYFSSPEDFMAWYEDLDETMYVDLIDISGELTSEKIEPVKEYKKSICSFKTNYFYFIAMNEKGARAKLDEIANKIKAKSRVSNAVLLGLGISLAAGAIAFGVKKLVDIINKKKAANKAFNDANPDAKKKTITGEIGAKLEKAFKGSNFEKSVSGKSNPIEPMKTEDSKKPTDLESNKKVSFATDDIDLGGSDKFKVTGAEFTKKFSSTDDFNTKMKVTDDFETAKNKLKSGGSINVDSGTKSRGRR